MNKKTDSPAVQSVRQGTAAQLPRFQDTFAGTIINVKDHGALGNDSADDAPALQAAIAAAGDSAALYFPPGTYLVSRPLELKVRQLWFSLTKRATLKALTNGTGFPILIMHSEGVELRHLIIDGAKDETREPADPAAAPGIWRRFDARGGVDLVVLDCRIRNAHGDGIRIQGGADSTREADRVIVRDTIVEDCGMNGLALGRVDHIRVESSRFERCNNGIKMLNCNDVAVSASTANANRRHGIAFTYSHRFHVDNCVARGNGSEGAGWGIAAGGEPIPDLEPNSEFTITNNICEENADGGITVDPTTVPEPEKPEKIWRQRASVSGNVCRNALNHHGIHVTHARDVVVSDNLCSDNHQGSGIQLVSSSHILVQGNTCFCNRNGIGLFSNDKVTDPGHHVIGINMLYKNEVDVRHQQRGEGQPLAGVRIHGLHGEPRPEGSVQAEPGTLYEWHEGEQGGMFVKEAGTGATGWVRAATTDGP
jgi:parallel beta-helix repeat protein